MVLSHRRFTRAGNLKANIVVIGGGGCGLAGAVSAAEKGARVILLEKNSIPGGNTSFVLGIFAAESQAQRRLNIDLSRDEAFKIAMDYAHWKIDPKIFRTFVDKSGDTIKWLEDKGLKFDNIPPLYPGHNIRTWHCLADKGAGLPIILTLRHACESLGIMMLFKCEAKKILTGNKGEVVGIIASQEGKELTIETKAVIIGTGGYGGNRELLKKYFPSYSEKMVYIGFPHVTGDGLRMAMEAGAATEGLGILMLHTHYYKGSIHINGMAQEPATLWVNKNGERFVNEMLTFQPTECGNIIDRQPDKCVYSLFDDKVLHKVMEEGLLKGVPPRRIPGVCGIRPTNLNRELQSESAKGNIMIADSWNDVASWMGVASGALENTVEEYNSSCDRGYDEIFNKDRRYLHALRTRPYYAIKGYLCFLTTLGGIKINRHMEVLNNQDEPISGFYAGGDTTGGWQSDTYCMLLPGTASGFAINSGRIAGENAAAFALEK